MLRFLHGVTLKQADLPERIPYARTPRKLPVVLGADEVVLSLEAVPSLKAPAALTMAYAAGLRASKAACIKVADIDGSGKNLGFLLRRAKLGANSKGAARWSGRSSWRQSSAGAR